MAAWTIQYWGDDGLRGKAVAAVSKSSALALANVPPSRVVKIERRLTAPSFCGRWSAPAAKIQMVLLARALALFAGGGAGLVNNLITSLPELRRLARKRAEILRDDLEFSAKLRGLEFAPEIVSIIEAGEKTGRLTQALETALTYLKQNTEIAQQNSKQFAFGVLLIAASLSLFFSLPLLLAEPIDTLRNLRDVRVTLTPATYVLLFVNAMVTDYWWLLCAGGAGASFAVWRYRRALSRVPPFSVFGSLEKTRRSIRFLIVWRAFRVAGIPLEEQAATLTSALGAAASARMFERLRRGESLTDTLDRRFFSATLTLAVEGLSQVGVEPFLKIVDLLLTSLREEQQAGAARVAAVMYACGAGLTIGTIALLALGLIFPIMGASAGAL